MHKGVATVRNIQGAFGSHPSGPPSGDVALGTGWILRDRVGGDKRGLCGGGGLLPVAFFRGLKRKERNEAGLGEIRACNIHDFLGREEGKEEEQKKKKKEKCTTRWRHSEAA